MNRLGLGWLRRGHALAALLVTIAGVAPATAATILHRGNGPTIATVDPALSQQHQDAAVIYDLFEGLLAYDAKGEPVPGVAERWAISEDGRTYTFSLRADARWSDGTAVTAEDFVHAWRRLADPATLSPYGYYTWPIVNGEAINKGEMEPTALGVEAVDARTFRVTLVQPTAFFLNQTIHTAMLPVQRANVEAHGAGFTQPGKLVSNGAFTLAENVPQSHVKVVKNPAYREADRVTLDGVMFHVTENNDTEFKRFRAGELHTTYTLPVNQAPWARENAKDSLRLAPGYNTFFVALNMSKEPWASNAKLRAALNLAVDRDIIVEKVLGGDNIPAFSLTPAQRVNGYLPPVPDWATLPKVEREAMARGLLAEAGYGPDGGKLPPVEILFGTSENNRRVAVAVSAMWKQVLGVDSVLTNQEFRVVMRIMNEKNYDDAVFFGWLADFPDPNTFLKLLRSDVAQQNPGAYANPEFDRLLAAANATTDPEARADMLRQAELAYLANHPIIPIWHNTRRRLVNPQVQNWHPNPLDFNLSRWLELIP